MNASRLKKKLQKQWRRWRRKSLTVGMGSLLVVIVWISMYLPEKMQALLTSKPPVAIETLEYYQHSDEGAADNSTFWKALNASPGKHEVIVRHLYICGEEEQGLGKLRPDEIYKIMNDHPDWKGRMDKKGKVWLEDAVSDLSPTCKQQAYMSLDKDGNLSLFDGPPQQEKVLKTFFQLDISSMESSLPDDALKHLYHGIRIQDIDEYNSVISTFSDYALEGSSKEQG